MKTHTFTLILAGVAEITPELADALYSATGGGRARPSRSGLAAAACGTRERESIPPARIRHAPSDNRQRLRAARRRARRGGSSPETRARFRSRSSFFPPPLQQPVL